MEALSLLEEEVLAQVESWKTLLPKIIAVLQHVEENHVVNQFVKSSLDDLRDLASDMEDILEEFVIDAKRSELIPNQEVNSMVKDLSGRLQKIDNGMRSLDLINLALKLEDKSHKVTTKRLPKSSLLEDKVLGRDSDKDAILQRLLEDGGSLEQDFVIPIIGMGGLGKTTLVRLIYNDEKLEGRKLTKLPTTIGNLIDLHHLDIFDTSYLQEMPSGIGNLKNLVTLPKLIVGKASGLMRLSDLKNLSQVRGRLSILDLQNVLDIQDAREANLDKIHGLEELVLGLVIQNCPKLLGQLPSNLSSLKELDVRRCNAMLLKSMGDLTSLANLRIEKISELTCLPMSMSLPSLKELYVENCNKVLLKSMVDLTSLTNLRIQHIVELPSLPENFTQFLTTLETLSIGDCDDLTCLWEEGPEVEQSLSPFNLKHLSLKQCKALESLPNAMLVQMDGSSSSNTGMLMLRLEKFEIYGCDSLKSFPRGRLPVTLKYLKIEGCKGLESLPDVDGDNNSNLHLEIRKVPCLHSSKGCHRLPTFLKKFTVNDGGERLESFPERIVQYCTGLQSIKIDSCKILKSLPNLDCISNLVELYIYSCEVLESLPEELGLY
ncbi:hypothetical protein SLEP1_g54264 [Rubroshorea leprosula]|uniref:Disease resistance protein n=1 Tax=Rubroshorea leprosula TaxID=152421 RepID=A0AAV5MES4_9ROSI|nr:hypothetical protein SLEP1_g54264 [Rubroshorea leprosula]